MKQESLTFERNIWSCRIKKKGAKQCWNEDNELEGNKAEPVRSDYVFSQCHTTLNTYSLQDAVRSVNCRRIWVFNSQQIYCFSKLWNRVRLRRISRCCRRRRRRWRTRRRRRRRRNRQWRRS